MCECCERLKKRVLEDERESQYAGTRPDYQPYTEFVAAVFACGMVGGKMKDMDEGMYFKMRFCPECGANVTRRIRQWKGISSYPPRRRRRGEDA